MIIIKEIQRLRKFPGYNWLFVNDWNTAFTYEFVDRYRAVLTTTLSGSFSKAVTTDYYTLYPLFTFDKYVYIEPLYISLSLDVTTSQNITDPFIDIGIAGAVLSYGNRLTEQEPSFWLSFSDVAPNTRVVFDTESQYSTHQYDLTYSHVPFITYANMLGLLVVNGSETTEIMSGSISVTIFGDIYVDKGVELSNPTVETVPRPISLASFFE